MSLSFGNHLAAIVDSHSFHRVAVYETSEDERNQRSAEGLQALAKHIRGNQNPSSPVAIIEEIWEQLCENESIAASFDHELLRFRLIDKDAAFDGFLRQLAHRLIAEIIETDSRDETKPESPLCTTRDAIVLLRSKFPRLKAVRIAEFLAVSRERVRQILKAEGLPTRVNPYYGACKVCGEELGPGRKAYCSTACRSVDCRVSFTCDYCGKAKEVRQSGYNAQKRRGYRFMYCSVSCRNFGKWANGREGSGSTLESVLGGAWEQGDDVPYDLMDHFLNYAKLRDHSIIPDGQGFREYLRSVDTDHQDRLEKERRRAQAFASLPREEQDRLTALEAEELERQMSYQRSWWDMACRQMSGLSEGE